jgi:hypothetical protein
MDVEATPFANAERRAFCSSVSAFVRPSPQFLFNCSYLAVYFFKAHAVLHEQWIEH